MSIHKTAAGPWSCPDLDALAMFLGAGNNTNTGGRNRYLCSYLVYKVGTHYYAENGSTGKIDFGGPSNEPAGTVLGTSAVAVLQATIDAMKVPVGTHYDGRGLIFIKGFLDITDSVDLTRIRNLRIIGLANKPMYTNPILDLPSSGFNIKTNNIPFDLTSSLGIQFENLSFLVEDGYIPPCVLLLAREVAGYQSGDHRFKNLVFEGDASSAMVYNYGTEQNLFETTTFRTKRRALIISVSNIDGLASPFRVIAVVDHSTNENDFIKCILSRPAILTPAGETILLKGPLEIRFFKSYFFGGGINLYAVKIYNQVRSLSFLECHFEQANILTIDAQGVITASDGVFIEKCFIWGSGNIIDMNKANVVMRNFYFDQNEFEAANYYLRFFELYSSYIRVGEVNEPYIYIAGASRACTIDLYSRAKLTNNNKTGAETRFYRESCTQAVTLGVGATTFVTIGDFVVLTGDPGANTVATITGGTPGQLLHILCTDALVTITDDNTHAANTIDLSGAFVSADDTVLTLLFDGTSWYETSRSVN